MPGPGTARERYYDGIRGVAVGLVVAKHWLAPYVPFFDGGYVGVDLFFVLSGFIITRILWRRTTTSGTVLGDYRSFLRGRARRLYPALTASLVLGTAACAALGVPVPVWHCVRSAVLAMTQLSSLALSTDTVNMDPFSHTWSLSVEWIFYLVWPVVLLVCRRRGTDVRTFAITSLGVALALYLVSLPIGARWFYFGFTARPAQILVGCSLSLWALRPGGLKQVTPAVASTAATVATLFVLGWAVLGPQELQGPYRFLGYPLVTLSAAVLCAVPLVAPRSGFRRWISVRPLAVVGLMSYSLYLWHLLPVEVLDKDRLHLSVAALGVSSILFTALVTVLSYRYLEKPFMTSRSRALGLGEQVTDPPAAPAARGS